MMASPPPSTAPRSPEVLSVLSLATLSLNLSLSFSPSLSLAVPLNLVRSLVSLSPSSSPVFLILSLCVALPWGLALRCLL